MPAMTEFDYERAALMLHGSPDHLVIRRLRPLRRLVPDKGVALSKAVFIDTETTGLDAGKDEVIELAVVPFLFNHSGVIYEALPDFHSYRQPSVPIPWEITNLTGITDAMVAGHDIDSAALGAVLADADLVIAHNAEFDRRFVEKLDLRFARLPWACSMADIDWRAEGFESRRLGGLALESGFFYDAHRATNDCLAGIELLSRVLPRSGIMPMVELIEQSHRTSYRIWAENSPFAMKDVLKARGYRWNDGANGRPKSWYCDIDADRYDEELNFLQTDIFGAMVAPQVNIITALERFTDRFR